MKNTVTLAKGLSVLAAEFATEVVASLANRGGGKSNGAAVIAEELLAAGVPVVVLDYVGIWFGLRLMTDGKTPSPFQIPVLGGLHGDIDLMPTTGTLVAEALAEKQSSAILDISTFSKGDRCRFATDFAEAFFRAKKKHPGPVQLVLEEAQRYVPQKLFTGQERMLGAFEEIAEVGRNYGVGLHLISQRPQKINKDVLNLADTVLAYRTNGVLERKALAEWVQEKGAAGRDDVKDELPGLERGQAIVWCPVRRVYGKFSVRLKATYDAGATPLVARAAVRTTPLDLGALKVAMGKVAEEAKENDPRHLKVEIARLRKELAAKAPAVQPVERRVDVPIVPPEWVEEIAKARAGLVHLKDQVVRELSKQVGYTSERLAQMVHLGGKYKPAGVCQPERRLSTGPASVNQPSRQANSGGSPEVGKGGLRRMLVALAQRPQGLNSRQLGVRAGMSSHSGTFSNYLGRARANGWIVDKGDVRCITDAGLQALGSFDPLPEGRELAAYWIRDVGGGASRMLQALVDAYPRTLTYAEVGEASGISAGSGTFSNYLGRLRALELVTGYRGQVRASEELI